MLCEIYRKCLSTGHKASKARLCRVLPKILLSLRDLSRNYSSLLNYLVPHLSCLLGPTRNPRNSFLKGERFHNLIGIPNPLCLSSSTTAKNKACLRAHRGLTATLHFSSSVTEASLIGIKVWGSAHYCKRREETVFAFRVSNCIFHNYNPFRGGRSIFIEALPCRK